MVAHWDDTGGRLEGRIVRLERLSAAHADALFEAAADERVWAWMQLNAGADRALFDRWISEALERTAAGSEVAWCVIARSGGRVVGSTRYLALRPEHRVLEIGWTWMHPAVWNTGANADAKLLLLEHAFERLGCMRVEFKTDARNERARQALEALGCRFDGIFRKHMLVRGGQIRDSAWYSILDDDWPVVCERLQARMERHLP